MLISPADRQMALQLIAEAVEAGARRHKATEILGLSQRTLQRWNKADASLVDRRTVRTQIPANKLSEAERQQVRDMTNSEAFSSLSPKQIVPALADRGEYIASESTIYRILREADLMHHRGRTAAPVTRPAKPEGFCATAANQVWSWDITYCASALRGVFYYLYLIMDVYSRKIVGWEVHETESADHAATLVRKACLAEQVQEDQVTLHSDNGSPMKGAVMLATLQKLGVAPSFSRPSVSNDNPYSEALFKTFKYRPDYPAKPFTDIDTLRQWVHGFVQWYNHEHRHSALQYVTPMQRHTGEDIGLLQQRAAVYQQAKANKPERWSRDTRDWSHDNEVWLNPSQGQANDDIQMKKSD